MTKLVERARRGELRRHPAGQSTMYHGEVFRQVLTDQVEFLRSHLLPPPQAEGDRRASPRSSIWRAHA